jgi:hypothetical protein
MEAFRMARKKKDSDQAPVSKTKKVASKDAETGRAKKPKASSTKSSPVSKASGGKAAPKTAKAIYQFKITLLDIKPAIWRRLQIPDCTLERMHEFIQGAFGWQNYHLHEFEIAGNSYSPLLPDDLMMLELKDDSKFKISKLIPEAKVRTRWIYKYDFGDGWRHEILFEGLVASDLKVKYPRCVTGKRACPPEDCGGSWGYEDFVKAISNPKHPRHKELTEWYGPYDPEEFDADEATQEMKRYIR